MTELLAPAKLNLSLVVGSKRADGKHEVATVLQRIALADTVRLEAAEELEVHGFPDDTLVRRALELAAAHAGAEPRWRATIEKQIPVASGLGGGSSDAAAALRLANEALGGALSSEHLHGIAAELGADVPFFLTTGPQLGEGDGTELTPLDLSQDYWVVLVMPGSERKHSTAAVYDTFDARNGSAGFEQRRAELTKALVLGDLRALPPNDLADSPLARELVDHGAFRAGVTGAGPALYGLFTEESQAVTAAGAFATRGDACMTTPRW
jgi:4-diphosphocytidyl-2-C-methyl-D-erythritol kinase